MSSSSSSDQGESTTSDERGKRLLARKSRQSLPTKGKRKRQDEDGDDEHGKRKRGDDEVVGEADPEALLALTAFEDRWEKDVAEWKTTKPGQRRSNMPQYLKQFNKEMKQDVWIAGKAFITHKADHKCRKACEQIMRKINPPEFHGLKGATLQVYEERWIKAHLPFTASSMNNNRNYFYGKVQKVYKAAFFMGNWMNSPMFWKCGCYFAALGPQTITNGWKSLW